MFIFLSAFSALYFFQYIDKLIYALVVALAQVVSHTCFHMARYHFAHKCLKSAFGGACLDQDIDAVCVIIYHVSQSADLSLYAAQAILQSAMLFGRTLFFSPAAGTYFFFTHNFLPLRRKALQTTQTEESDIASPAIIGLSSGPPKAYSNPAATGIPIVL